MDTKEILTLLGAAIGSPMAIALGKRLIAAWRDVYRGDVSLRRAGLEAERDDKERMWEQITATIDDLRETVARHEDRIVALEKERIDLLAKIAEKDIVITRLEAALAKKTSDCEVLESVNQELEREVARLKTLVTTRAATA